MSLNTSILGEVWEKTEWSHSAKFSDLQNWITRYYVGVTEKEIGKTTVITLKTVRAPGFLAQYLHVQRLK